MTSPSLTMFGNSQHLLDFRDAGFRDRHRVCFFVNGENKVDLIDDRVVQLTLRHITELPGHVISKVIEADFVVGDVGDVAMIHLTPRCAAGSKSC
jgi:hypothetical protein